MIAKLVVALLASGGVIWLARSLSARGQLIIEQRRRDVRLGGPHTCKEWLLNADGRCALCDRLPVEYEPSLMERWFNWFDAISKRL